MNFKTKAYLQQFFSLLPRGERINFFFQKNLTKSLPISDEDFLVKLTAVVTHFNNYLKYSLAKNVNDSTYYEFGAGYDMLIPISMSLLGFKKLICIDIRELVFPELLNDSIKRLRKFGDKFGIDSELIAKIPLIDNKNYKDVLKQYLKIEYIAPLDARNTGIKECSIDFILSNATMEHIPSKDLGGIMKECFRILKPNGIVSNVIDYRDHWSFFDNSISVYNYLQYTDRQWNKLNPSLMYQNRMRHKDYIEIISNTGFEILEEKADNADEYELKKLEKINLDTSFREKYSKEELSVKSSMLVLKKP